MDTGGDVDAVTPPTLVAPPPQLASLAARATPTARLTAAVVLARIGRLRI